MNNRRLGAGPKVESTANCLLPVIVGLQGAPPSHHHYHWLCDGVTGACRNLAKDLHRISAHGHPPDFFSGWELLGAFAPLCRLACCPAINIYEAIVVLLLLCVVDVRGEGGRAMDATAVTRGDYKSFCATFFSATETLPSDMVLCSVLV